MNWTIVASLMASAMYVFWSGLTIRQSFPHLCVLAAVLGVGPGSDLGGGASVMGTLSGGGTQVIRVGERCLVGANAGIGISLGDDCVVEAGLYVTAGTRVTLPDGAGRQGPGAERPGRPALPPQQRDRRGAGAARGPATGAASTPPCTRTTEPASAREPAQRSQQVVAGLTGDRPGRPSR